MSLCAFKAIARSGLFFRAIECHREPVALFPPFYRLYLYNLGCFPFTTSPKFAGPENYQKPPSVKNAKPRRASYKTGFPFSAFAAGAAKRRSKFNQKETEETNDGKTHVYKGNIIEVPAKPLFADEWKILKEESISIEQFEYRMMLQIIASNGDINVAKSLLVFAARENSIDYKLLQKYLCLCVMQNQTSEIFDIYEIMKTRFKRWEKGAYTLFIKGFSQTDRWEESLSLLEAMKKIETPSSRSYGSCIQGALDKKKGKIAWGLYHEMLENNLTPRFDTLKAFFDTGKALKDDGIFKNELMEVLWYMRNNQVYPNEALMQSIKSWFESIPGEDWKGYTSVVENSGRCRVCSQSLESINLSQEEYDILKDVILNDVIHGNDTFRKTTPKELQKFQRFVTSCPPFDIVIDGLNTAKSPRQGINSEVLLSVVSFFAQKNLRLLVLGRKHMLRTPWIWWRQHMDLIQQKANCFFTENISQDDPFLLYATLHSGNHCRFITNDLLRDHKACLRDTQTQRLFFKWQRGHQLMLLNYYPGKQPTFQPVLNYDTIVQTTGDTWHIPYDADNVERVSYEVPRTWLCLQRKDHKT
uniref:Mitochondrial ribonuclease P catalytic subunit n=1 Tax=Geotrypetes seraphini TaxID=260995 RepID=A0A6P8RS25_GEOSA|nr:mitochondrial ribonuclease P catalytic subunit isoform X2 [Geotrypetes seraphini]